MAEELKDANSRLMARRRASVPPRDTSLVKRVREPESEANPVTHTPVAATRARATEPVPQQPQQLIASTIRLEVEIEQGLKTLCSSERITKETFLEAAFQVCQENEEILDLVLAAARVRREARKQVGLQRRAESMSSKYL